MWISITVLVLTKIWPISYKNVITKINVFHGKMFAGVGKVRLEILFFFPSNFFIMGGVKVDEPWKLFSSKIVF
jgi:hypothetical protein